VVTFVIVVTAGAADCELQAPLARAASAR
jgi:hypothetical protein